MNKDQIWQEIKNDKSKIYGEKVLDLFLKVTDRLDPKHYEELTPEQKKQISPNAATYILASVLGGEVRFHGQRQQSDKFDDPQKALEFLGLDNFNKIEDPIHLLAFPGTDRAEQIIDLVKKHHKNSKKLAARMCLNSKNPEEIIKEFGDDVYSIQTTQELTPTQSRNIESNLTKRFLLHAFSRDKLKEVGELLKEKIASMKEDDFKDFVLNLSNTRNADEKPVQDLALKYRSKLTPEEIRIIAYKDKDNEFLWKVFEKQGINDFGGDELLRILKPDPEKAIKIIGKENIKKAVVQERRGVGSTAHLKMIGFSSVVGNLLKSNLNFASFFGSEIITLMDHMDLEYLLEHYKKLREEKFKLAIETIKKYHKEFDKRVARNPKLKSLIGDQNDP